MNTEKYTIMCIPYLVTRIRGSPVDYTSYPIVKESSSFLEEAVTQKWHCFFHCLAERIAVGVENGGVVAIPPSCWRS